MTPHSPAFLSAVAHVSALLGPADAERENAPTVFARWRCSDGTCLTIRACVDTPDAVLVAERLSTGDFREWRAIGDATVRDACAWLSWEVPRPDINALLDARDARRRAPAGYDGDGRLATDDGCAETFDDYPTDAA